MSCSRMAWRSITGLFPHRLYFYYISILFKMAVAPFHFWSPDVYDGSPTVVTTFMTTIVKLGSSITMYYFSQVIFKSI
jgi:NADH:ubiquinone oxidoreductase subunit 2 (subunit N)